MRRGEQHLFFGGLLVIILINRIRWVLADQPTGPIVIHMGRKQCAASAATAKLASTSTVLAGRAANTVMFRAF